MAADGDVKAKFKVSISFFTFWKLRENDVYFDLFAEIGNKMSDAFASIFVVCSQQVPSAIFVSQCVELIM